MMKLKWLTRRGAIRLGVLGALLVALSIWGYSCMIWMPGQSHRGPLPALTSQESELAGSIRKDVVELAEKIGIRNVGTHPQLIRAADYVESRFKEAGFTVGRQTYTVAGRPCSNLEVELRGSTNAEEIVVIGGHYDSVIGCPGANDNATGTAGTLALARLLAKSAPARTLRFVAFVNEEPPHFRTSNMGSRVYARRCRERKENVVAMLSLETIGCFSDEEGSQHYPWPFGMFYPSKGDFIAFVGNIGSRPLVRRCVKLFREKVPFPSEGGALPGWIAGVGWSDHESFWEEGYPGVMVTDTAPFRYPHYHLTTDTPEKIDYERCARVVAGVEKVVRVLAEIP